MRRRRRASPRRGCRLSTAFDIPGGQGPSGELPAGRSCLCSADLLHAVAAAARRVLVSAVAFRGALRHGDLTSARAIRTAVHLALLQCHFPHLLSLPSHAKSWTRGKVNTDTGRYWNGRSASFDDQGGSGRKAPYISQVLPGPRRWRLLPALRPDRVASCPAETQLGAPVTPSACQVDAQCGRDCCGDKHADEPSMDRHPSQENGGRGDELD
jgi:hypothetical protein